MVVFLRFVLDGLDSVIPGAEPRIVVRGRLRETARDP